VRRDLADVFCTTIEGVRADRAKVWGLVDDIATPSTFGQTLSVARRISLRRRGSFSESEDRATARHRAHSAQEDGYRVRHRYRTSTSRSIAPVASRHSRCALQRTRLPDSIEAITAQGADWWPLALARELDDAMLLLRTKRARHRHLGDANRRDPAAVLAVEATPG
jgi:benzoyl-CoA-dihydrodiol lyase